MLAFHLPTTVDKEPLILSQDLNKKSLVTDSLSICYHFVTLRFAF